MDKIKNVLSQQLENIKIDDDTLNKIKAEYNSVYKKLNESIKKLKIDATVFLGGSYAKKTLTKKDSYDIDIFVRFANKYNDSELSGLLEKILKKVDKNFEKVHGSRDYYKLIKDNIILELIPVKRVVKPEGAVNVTDLSYFHVKYILNKIKENQSLENEIKLAKSFVLASKCYGAESYVKGFSGYSIELLVTHYKSFYNFIKNISENKKDTIIIDDEKHYMSTNDVLMRLNEAKIQSPIILIDPTNKDRNALAGLSNETFLKFKKYCYNFFKNPSRNYFTKKDTYQQLKRRFKKITIVKIKTNKQNGDISGTKSKKFYRFFVKQLKKEFNVKKSEFEYIESDNISKVYLVLAKKLDELVQGPPITAVEHLTNFKKLHPDAIIKKGHAYVKVKHDKNFEEFFEEFKTREKSVIKEMGITDINLED